MSNDETLKIRLNELSKISREYVSWFMAFSRCVAYGGSQAPEVLEIPKSFIGWHLQASLDETLLLHESLHQLKTIHDELHAAAQEVAGVIQESNDDVSEDAYANLCSLYDAFLAGMQRLQRDCMLQSTGVDPYSGLLNRKSLDREYAIEMERFERGGSPFCLAFIRVDDFRTILAENDAEDVAECIRKMVKFVRKSLRSFDNGFAIGYGEFILLLKQSDITGGVSTLDRLRGMLDDEEMYVTTDGKKTVMTFSSCIASPVEGDDLDQLLDNLKDDLNNQAERAGSIVEYQEISALERYAQSIDQ